MAEFGNHCKEHGLQQLQRRILTDKAVEPGEVPGQLSASKSTPLHAIAATSIAFHHNAVLMSFVHPHSSPGEGER